MSTRTQRLFWSDDRKLVRDFASPPAAPNILPLIAGTSVLVENHFGRWNPVSQRWLYVEPPAGFKLAIGGFDTRPEAGTFTITNGVNTTAGIALAADATTVQNALTAATITGWTVNKPASGTPRWTLTRTTAGSIPLLGVNTAGLSPSSFADVYPVQEGTTEVAEIQEIELYANPAGYQDTWDDLPTLTVDVDVDAAGGGGENAQQTIRFTPLPHSGAYAITMPNGKQTPTINYGAGEAEILEAIQRDPAYDGDGDVAVSGAAFLGQITITFQGTLANEPQAAMSVRTQALVMPIGLKGEVDLRTPAAKNLVRGTSAVVATPIEGRAIESGLPSVVGQGSVGIQKGLIHEATQAGPIASPLLDRTTGIVSGAAVGVTTIQGDPASLNEVDTVSLPLGTTYFMTVPFPGNGHWQLTAGTDLTDVNLGVLRPTDYAAVTNEKVWRRRREEAPGAVDAPYSPYAVTIADHGRVLSNLSLGAAVEWALPDPTVIDAGMEVTVLVEDPGWTVTVTSPSGIYMGGSLCVDGIRCVGGANGDSVLIKRGAGVASGFWYALNNNGFTAVP